MALSDPLILTVDSVALSYARQSEGKYIDSATSLSEPSILSLERTLNPSATSTYLVKFTEHALYPDPSGKLLKDTLSAHTVIKVAHRSFDDAAVSSIVDRLNTFTSDSALLGRFLRGER
jgi:hypothetical protein